MTLTFKQGKKITINECPFSFNKEIEIVDFYTQFYWAKKKKS